ncbi:type I restriction endonuclease subunit R [Pseudactinotalea sp. Z1748]|uniref:type I restriction endonuclease subunit R n=1 Tax=Pseudactinotalea sp. Z1748 TaxID=3413027 RepID=UPI003C79E029
MSKAQIMEAEFEENICDALATSGWEYSGSEAADPQWDPALALHKADVLRWLAHRHQEEYERAIPAGLAGTALQQAENGLLQRVAHVLAARPVVDPNTFRERNGLLGVLRTGFDYIAPGRPAAKFGGMVEFPPENPLLIQSQQWFDDNRLRVLRQVRFDSTKTSTIDLVLLVNGIPVITMELKTDHTQQASSAVEQYRKDRMPTKNTPLLQPGRCLVHFVASNQLVLMTTALKGRETHFIPFDKGNSGHAGNASSATGSPTDYLWREVLRPSSLIRILNSFAMREKDGTLVFPRYHQLRAVEKVTGDVAESSAGGRYLIWHSAGSGKTKTIAWLSHRLGRLFGVDGEKVFDSIIVVSDRRVLDDQIRRAVNLLGASKGYVVGITEGGGSKSSQLHEALTEGDHIITVTLQSFPESLKIINDSSELKQRRWCVIADEAHSSQTGEAAGDLRKLLASRVEQDPDPDDDQITTDDLLLAQDSAVAEASNMTFVALTATPKHRTLRLFGTKTDRGWEAFDTYTMAQAIEEGFILDVLRRYSTYDMFAKVRDTATNQESGDILVDGVKAVSSIVRFVRLHRIAIAQKVEVVIEHFRANVASSLNGRARAMVVTSSREEAVRWSIAMNDYLAKQGYHDMTALVAFSGKINVDGEEYTEPTMTGVSEKALPTHFRETDAARVLIVADKFQTGYDEPLLCAMYVDKSLSGIATVQTLSRLNRPAPDKPTPIVVDFVNDPQRIQEAFAEYYSDAYISQETDPNVLFNLANRLDLAGYYDTDELYEISEAYLTGAGGEAIGKVLNPVVLRWNEALQSASTKAEKEEVLAFRSYARTYRNAWDFLSQVIDYQDPVLHRRAILAGLLVRNLHTDVLIETIDTSRVELTGVAVVATSLDQDQSVLSKEPVDLPAPSYDGDKTYGGRTPEQIALQEAIDKVNQLFAANGLNLGNGSGESWTRAVWGVLSEDQDVQAMSAENSEEQLMASPRFRDKITGAVVSVASDSQAMTEAAMANTDLYNDVVELLAKVSAVVHGKQAS